MSSVVVGTVPSSSTLKARRAPLPPHRTVIAIQRMIVETIKILLFTVTLLLTIVSFNSKFELDLFALTGHFLVFTVKYLF
jgi:hypothetical protein